MVKKGEWIVEEFDEMFGDGIIFFDTEKYMIRKRTGRRIHS